MVSLAVIMCATALELSAAAEHADDADAQKTGSEIRTIAPAGARVYSPEYAVFAGARFLSPPPSTGYC